MATYYPPPAFHFTVSFDGDDSDAAFQEVSGLEVHLESKDVVEGGQNRFVHRLPTRTKYSNLMMKRGTVTKSSPLARWLSDCFTLGPARRVDAKTIVIQLLDESAAPLIVWKVVGAYPARWDHAALQSEENHLMIESVELTYQFFDRTAAG